MRYCESTYRTKRWKTREVKVGKVGVGGDNPIRIQSMTTSNTRDVEETVDQIIRLADSGCEIARVTVQGKKEAEACEGIKNLLLQKGYEIPVVADIHFYPPAAMQVAEFVDKVRVNPGNFVDRRATFRTIEYDDASYQAEIQKIEETFGPLVEKCKRLGRAMRIGTNHGSLSDRIMNRYGDTPFGMVESALEFARVCRNYDYHDFMFSMKASNPLVMMQAYRLLVAEMMKIGWDYPLHLGVTEAGNGEDGRVKSAMGIGSLLLDGLGDTIRVSLTEDPWHEIDPCKRLIKLANDYQGRGVDPFEEKYRKVDAIERREVTIDPKTNLHRDGSVILPKSTGEWYSDDIGMVADPQMVNASERETWEAALVANPNVIFLNLTHDKLHEGRAFFEWIRERGLTMPVILQCDYDLDEKDLVIHAATELGALLSDGLGEGVCLGYEKNPELAKSLSFSILQAARMRSTKTDFIACPGCGRTLFDLQEVTERIKEKTSHLPGVKIAIMGCIVNGPGEMADADFGYVGSKAGKIDLYVGKTCVERGIDFKLADEKLIDLIKAHGRWSAQNEAVFASDKI